MNVLCIIQARLGSTRLPRKVLMPLPEDEGKPLICHVVERVQRVRGVSRIVVATPAQDCGEIGRALQPSNVETLGVPNIDDWDVLRRFAQVAQQYPECDTIMRVTADCPLFAPEIAERVLRLYQTTKHCEYAWNASPGYIDGVDCEVFSASALVWANREATEREDREHVGPWLRRHVKVATLPPMTKLSIDSPEEYERVSEIMAQVSPGEYSLASTLFAVARTMRVVDDLEKMDAARRRYGLTT